MARDLIVTTNDKKLSYKALSGAGVKEMQKCVGDRFHLSAIIQGKVEKDEEEKILTCLVTSEGEIYQTLSPTVDDNIQHINQIFNVGEEDIEIEIGEGESNNGRKFLQLSVI